MVADEDEGESSSSSDHDSYGDETKEEIEATTSVGRPDTDNGFIRMPERDIRQTQMPEPALPGQPQQSSAIVISQEQGIPSGLRPIVDASSLFHVYICEESMDDSPDRAHKCVSLLLWLLVVIADERTKYLEMIPSAGIERAMVTYRPGVRRDS